MIKKILITILAIGVISGGAWYAWQAESPSVENSDDKQPIAESGEVSDASGDAPVVAVNESLKLEAEKIITRPVPAGASELVARKIRESIDLIRSNYDYANPWYDLAAYRKMAGDNQGAIDAWNFLIKIRPADYVAYHNLGDMYAFTLKNYVKAEEYFLESIEKNPKNVDAYIQLVSIYEFNDVAKSALAEPLLLNGIKANPENINLKIALARYYQRMGNLESARSYFEKALALDPENKSLAEELKALGN